MALRTRLSVEWLELRDNPSVPGGDAPYSPPGPTPTDPATVASPPASPVVDTGTCALSGAQSVLIPSHDINSVFKTSTAPYSP